MLCVPSLESLCLYTTTHLDASLPSCHIVYSTFGLVEDKLHAELVELLLEAECTVFASGHAFWPCILAMHPDPCSDIILLPALPTLLVYKMHNYSWWFVCFFLANILFCWEPHSVVMIMIDTHIPMEAWQCYVDAGFPRILGNHVFRQL